MSLEQRIPTPKNFRSILANGPPKGITEYLLSGRRLMLVARNDVVELEDGQKHGDDDAADDHAQEDD